MLPIGEVADTWANGGRSDRSRLNRQNQSVQKTVSGNKEEFRPQPPRNFVQVIGGMSDWVGG